MTMKRAYADLRHGQVHYVEAGAGTPLLLMHSAPRSSRASNREASCGAVTWKPKGLPSPGWLELTKVGTEKTAMPLACSAGTETELPTWPKATCEEMLSTGPDPMAGT